MEELIASVLKGTSLNEDESSRLLLEDYFGEDSPTSFGYCHTSTSTIVILPT